MKKSEIWDFCEDETDCDACGMATKFLTVQSVATHLGLETDELGLALDFWSVATVEILGMPYITEDDCRFVRTKLAAAGMNEVRIRSAAGEPNE